MVRELVERLGFRELIERHLVDGRGKNSHLPFADLLRRSVYSWSPGYGDLNDVARLAHDPTFRLIGSKENWGTWRGADLALAIVRNDAARQPGPSGHTLSRSGAARRAAIASICEVHPMSIWFHCVLSLLIIQCVVFGASVSGGWWLAAQD